MPLTILQEAISAKDWHRVKDLLKDNGDKLLVDINEKDTVCNVDFNC